MIFDAVELAPGWLTISLASGVDKERPILHRTIYVEQYPDGVRLVATDSYMLLHCWVADVEHPLVKAPDIDESPIATAIVLDASPSPSTTGRSACGARTPR